MWRLLAIAGIAMTLSACNLLAPTKKPPPVKANLADRLKVGCYTVDLFDPYRLKYPKAGVPREHSRFIGAWKDAAWNGEWCHDLYITDVRADGTVTLLDAHGPNRKQGREATVFKRTAKISNGVLTFQSVGGATVTYRLSEDGSFLLGKRSDISGKYDITMARRDGVPVPPIPPRKPARS